MSSFTRFRLFSVAVAVLITGCSHSSQKPTFVEEKIVKHGRNLADIHFTADLTQEQVVAIWGQPDALRGFGIDYKEYNLENGQKVWIQFLSGSSNLVACVRLFSTNSDKSKILYSR